MDLILDNRQTLFPRAGRVGGKRADVGYPAGSKSKRAGKSSSASTWPPSGRGLRSRSSRESLRTPA